MKKIIFMAVWLLALPLFAQKNTKKVTDNYTSQLTTLIQNSTGFLNANKLSSPQMKKMMNDTFRAIADNDDFVKASDKYFSTQYTNDLINILKPYYKDLTIQQIDSLISINSADNIHRAMDGLALCTDADYRDNKVDEMLNATVTAKNEKAKAKAIKKIKKNMSKYKSDCTDEYRQALSMLNPNALQSSVNLSEEYINAIYHTVSLDDLKAYTSVINSRAVILGKQAEAAVTDDIYNVQTECVSHFQTWTYKAFPSIFTKKQVVPKKRKGKKGKKNNNTQQSKDTIIEGGIYY